MGETEEEKDKTKGSDANTQSTKEALYQLKLDIHSC